MAAGSSEVSQPIAIVAIIILIVAVVAGGIWYINKPPRDEIAAAVLHQRGNGPAPIGPGAPMGGVPPKAGPTDYSRATPMPSAPSGR